MNDNFNWSKHFDQNSIHYLLNWTRKKINYQNLELNRHQVQLKNYYSKNDHHDKFKNLSNLIMEFTKNSRINKFKNKQMTNRLSNSCVNFVNNKLINRSKLLNHKKMHFYKIEYLLFILIYLIQFINCIQLTINPSNNYLNSKQPTKSTPLQFINTIRLNKRFIDDIYKNNDNDLSLSSSENDLTKLNNNILENNLNLNNLTINLNNETKLIDELDEQKNRQEIEFKEEQEKILNEIESINSGTVCGQLNKQTNFKTKGNKDSSKENRDKNYWILVKALEPKSIKMPTLTNQIQPNHEIKEYYHELIEKLKLITSILYDNNGKQDQTNQQQHNLLMRKIIREISYLHPHIIKARLITLDLNKDKQRKRRDLTTSFNYQDNNNNFQEYLNDDLNDEQSNLDNLEQQNDNLLTKQIKQNTVPFRRISRQSSDRLIAVTENLDQKTINEQLLFAKNILFYIKGEPIYEFNDITLTTNKEHVSWLDIKEVDETSGTINEFEQLLAKGHLFVMSEKERLFSGWTGYTFDCATRKWVLSYTNLLVSCNECTNKKQSESLVDNELEMRLIGLLSVDIDLASVDINQCELLSNENESSLAKINELNNVPQVKSFTQPTISMQKTNQLNLNAQESNKFNSFLNDNNFNLFLNQNDNNSQLIRLKFNDTSINQPQRLVSSSIISNSIVNYNNSSKLLKSNSNKFGNRLILHFDKTNKCHKETSECQFVPNKGIRKGLGYICKCKPGYYALLSKFQGKEIEHAYENQNLQKNISPDNKPYDRMYICKKCAIGCDTCVDSSPCLSSYNWAFRVSLLIISCLCICLIFVLSYYIYKYRKIKVFKVASPVFLTLTLLGCSIMYAEMIMIFPILNRFWCILTKITRHMGFCITYSALLLKTWRVSLTYRVKSAHKLKLTDRQLLQWLFPILLIMSIFLSTWIISDPPREVVITDWNRLKFTICEYNWFDHSLAIGEFLFLLWGIKVCYNVRNAESFFNEARYITYAIYNIAAVNILMILIHLIILPNAGPDEKYFLGFVRTQLSTTTTILLIFGPKFYRLIKGEGDVWNAKIRARRGINASFSLNGVGVVHEELTDLYQENEELKEQVHKLATQVELMRLRQMQINNRHLKSKHNIGSTASSQAVNSSVVVNSANVTAGLVGLANTGPHFHSYSYNQLNPQVDSAGIGLVTGLVGGVVGGQPVLTPGIALNAFTQPATATCQRISPAAELQSEKV